MSADALRPAPAAAPPADQQPLRALLARLAATGDPGMAYERLRSRLVTYFRFSFPLQAETLADTALDRLARRLHQGTVVDDVAAYTLGIARLLTLETQTRTIRERRALLLEGAAAQQDTSAADDGVIAGDTDHQLSSALEACLQRLDRRSRRLILEYYGDDDGQRIRARRQLAARLRLSPNALRNRALRLRASLEDCIRRRLQAAARRDGSASDVT